MAWLQAFDTLAGHAAILLPSASVGGRVTRLVLLGSYRAMEGGCSDPQHPRHLPNGLASIKQALCPRPANPCLRSSDPGSPSPCCGNSAPGAFPNHLPFQLGNGTDDMERKSACRGAGVDAVGHAYEVDVLPVLNRCLAPTTSAPTRRNLSVWHPSNSPSWLAQLSNRSALSVSSVSRRAIFPTSRPAARRQALCSWPS